MKFNADKHGVHHAPQSALASSISKKGTPAKVWSGRCVSVLDGDTLIILRGDSTTQVHLYAVDAPEKAQPFGKLSKAALWELGFGQTLMVYPVAKPEGGEPVMGWAFAGKMCLNTEQVRLGMAWWDQMNAPHESKVAALEARARSKHEGLWQGKAPFAPWLWRASRPNSQMELPLQNSPEIPSMRSPR